MPEHNQEDRRGGEVETETGERLKGPTPANLAQGKPGNPPQDKEVLSQASPGEERKPDQPIGQVAHMRGNDNSEGGAGPPQESDLEPEKQGGIGGP